MPGTASSLVEPVWWRLMSPYKMETYVQYIPVHTHSHWYTTHIVTNSESFWERSYEVITGLRVTHGTVPIKDWEGEEAELWWIIPRSSGTAMPCWLVLTCVADENTGAGRWHSCLYRPLGMGSLRGRAVISVSGALLLYWVQLWARGVMTWALKGSWQYTQHLLQGRLGNPWQGTWTCLQRLAKASTREWPQWYLVFTSKGVEMKRAL